MSQEVFPPPKDKSATNRNSGSKNNKHAPVGNKDVCILNSDKDLESCGYTIGKKLNSGSFSRVHQANHNGVDCAVKIINLGKATSNFIYKLLPREIVILKKLRHPNIIFLHDIVLIQTNLYIFMELADGGDLLDFIVAEGALGEPKAKRWFRQIVDALSYCHKLGVAHRDIKCENLLINSGFIKLTDFGFACIMYDTETRRKLMSTTYCGSISYVAPEILLNVPYDATQSDIWSLGVVLYVMLDNQLPFEIGNLTETVKYQINGKWSFVADKVDIISEEAKELIKCMLDPNPSSRPNIAKVMEARWLKNTDNSITCGKQDDNRNCSHYYVNDGEKKQGESGKFSHDTDTDGSDHKSNVSDKRETNLNSELDHNNDNDDNVSDHQRGHQTKKKIIKRRKKRKNRSKCKAIKYIKKSTKPQQLATQLPLVRNISASFVSVGNRKRDQQVPENYKLRRMETEPFIARESPERLDSNQNKSKQEHEKSYVSSNNWSSSADEEDDRNKT